MECSTLECHSNAVAITVGNASGQNVYCIECAIKVVKQWGPKSLESIPGIFIAPWGAFLHTEKCSSCGVEYSSQLIGLTGDCPKCRRPLPEYMK